MVAESDKWRISVPVCDHCGRSVTNVRKVRIVYTESGKFLCQPQTAYSGHPNCFGLVTTYGHATPCSLCRELFPLHAPVQSRAWPGE